MDGMMDDLVHYAVDMGFDFDPNRDGVIDELIQFIEELAVSGDPKAMFYYGGIILSSTTDPEEIQLGIGWISKAAEQGCEEAKALIAGVNPRNGESILTEIDDSVIGRAESGDTEAQMLLASAYMSGNGIEQDETEGMRWFEIAAKSGNPEIQFYYATLLLDSYPNDDEKQERGMYWLKEAAEAGYGKAKRYYSLLRYIEKAVAEGRLSEDADFYEKLGYVGEQAELGDQEAAACFDRSDEREESFAERSMPFIEELIEEAEDGNEDAILELARMYMDGTDGVKQNPEQAAVWMTKAAELGYDMAMFNLAIFYAKGFGVERNFETASNWMRKAYENGDSDAEKMIHEYAEAAKNYQMALQGDYVAMGRYASALMAAGRSLSQADNSKDFAESLEWAHKAEGKDNGEAYYVLGAAYENARGVAKDLEKAVEYYTLGAKQKHDICLNNLGMLLMRGEGCSKDSKRGFECFLQAAEIGYDVAMGNLGQCYHYGDGTETDYEKAAFWYKRCLELSYDPDIERKLQLLKFFLKN